MEQRMAQRIKKLKYHNTYAAFTHAGLTTRYRSKSLYKIMFG